MLMTVDSCFEMAEPSRLWLARRPAPSGDQPGYSLRRLGRRPFSRAPFGGDEAASETGELEYELLEELASAMGDWAAEDLGIVMKVVIMAVCRAKGHR